MSRKKLISNFIYNTLYQVLVLITPLITTPYISRVLGVTNIGIYQYAQSIANYFVLIGAVGTTLYGQREIAYLQDREDERSKVFWEIEVIRIVSTILCTIIYLSLFCFQGTYFAVYLILVQEVIATGIDISWLYMGMENFKIIVFRNTIIRVIGIISVFLFVKSPEDLGIYTLCVTTPMIIGNISLWFSINKYLVRVNLSALDLVLGIRKRVRPILTLFLPQMAMDVYLLLDKTMIGIFGTNIDQVGYYSQGQKIVKIILTLVTSLGTVMLPTMSALFAKGDIDGIKKSILSAFKFIYLISFAMLFGLIAIAPQFVPVFFGDGYEPVVSLMIIISPILIIIATSNVIGKQYLLPTNQQRAFTVSIISGAVVNFVLNIILISYWDAIGASIATVIAELVVTIVQCIYVRKQLPLMMCFISGIKYFVLGLIMLIIIKIMNYCFAGNGIVYLFTMIVIGACVYGIELLLVKDQTFLSIFTIIRSRIVRKEKKHL